MYDHDWLLTWSERFRAPFYLLDTNRLVANYTRMERAYTSRYENVIIAYSYKTNYVPFLCRTLHDLGAYAEVVSRLEYDLARKNGMASERIVFNGPIKREEDIEQALGEGSILNLDSFYEIPAVVSYAKRHPEQVVKVGLRANFDLSMDGSSPLQNGYAVSRFGFCVENGNFHRAVEQLRQVSNIRIVGLHGHFSTNRSLAVYERITRELCHLAKEYLKDCLEYIDVGGGMYGELPASFGKTDIPSCEDYAAAITGVLHEEMSPYDLYPTLIVEPGVSLVADAVHFVCRVMDVKENRGSRFVVVDGSVHNVKPTMHKLTLPFHLVEACGGERTPDGSYHIVGYTCMEKDYLVEDVCGPSPLPGDFLVFGHVGAYTLVFQPPFIQGRPPILALTDEGELIVREKETLAQFCQDDCYRFAPGVGTKGEMEL